MNPTLRKKSTAPLSVAALILLSGVSTALAIDYTWDAGGDGVNWTDPANWDQNSSYPRLSGDKAIFSGTATNVSLSANVTTNLQFDSSGWDISGAGNMTFNASNVVTSTNASGTNTINNRIAINGGNSAWDIGAGGTVVHTGIFDNSLNINKSGDGTLIMNSSLIGLSGSGINTSAGLTLINYSTTKTINTFMQTTGGGVLGGSGSIAFGHAASNSYQLRINASSALNPGGDGSAAGGSVIGTFSVSFSDTGSNANENVIRFADGGILHIDLDTVSDTSDQLAISLAAGTKNGTMQFNGTGVILELETLGLVDLSPGESFTIASYATSPVDGGGNTGATFGTITLNGVDITSDIGTTYFLNYNPTSLEFGMVPEPSFYAMLAGLACLGVAVHRRRGQK